MWSLFIILDMGTSSSTAKDSQYASIALRSNRSISRRIISQKMIVAKVQQRRPRLSFVIFDCYGRFLDANDAIQLPSGGSIIRKHPILPGLKTLFLKSKGTIVACSDSRFERALGNAQGEPVGGIFTSCFLRSIRVYGTEKNIDWVNIQSGVLGYCNMIAKQYPYFKYAVRSRCSDPVQKSLSMELGL